MKKIQLTYGKQALVDDSTYGLLSQFGWTIDKRNNCVISTAKDLPERRMSRMIMNAQQGEVVDHIDGNPLNNQFVNLRICTQKQNMYNRKINKNSKSGYKGVTYNKGIEMYTAQIRYNGKLKYLGSYMNKKEAAEAYNNAATKQFGEYARLNQL